MVRYFYIDNRRLNCLLRCLNYFGEMNLKLFNRIMQRINLTSNFYKNEKHKFRQGRFPCRGSFGLIIIIFSIINLIQFFSTTTTNPDIHLEIYSVYKSRSLLANESLELNIHNHSIHHIYIDLGCFNGETIEHFIHFIPNSSLYDIITFEPDPINYVLCKKRLSQEKYRNFNIIIIPKVVWIRDEKVLYRTDRGPASRVAQRETKDDSNSIKLDGIDFSSWLSRLIKPNNTKAHIKISTPGIEVQILKKMVFDDTLTLADRWEVEWTDRSNPRMRGQRLYVQQMFDSLGFGCPYLTHLPNVRKIFRMKSSYDNITKYYDWRKIAEYDTFAHYFQRPVVLNPPLTPKNKVKRKKF